MNILIVGSGAREHAIAAAMNRSSRSMKLFYCGTTINPGMNAISEDKWIGDITDVLSVTQMAQSWHINLAIIGPEAPLEKGLADALWQANIPTVGPKKALAQIETSKAFARHLMEKYHIDGLPEHRFFQTVSGIEDFLNHLGEDRYVVKANGLMSGKGVKIAGEHLHSIQEALQFAESILAQGQSVIIEEKLIGQEFSLMCFCDGNQIFPMPVVQDHKRAFTDDKGPNTGGMGSYSDINHRLPFLSKEDVINAQHINERVYHALMQACRDKYIGILYGSFISTQKGIYVIEFNARFGDPEVLNVLSLLTSDFLTLCEAMVTGQLTENHARFSHHATVCKYAVPEGYPDHPKRHQEINFSAVENPSQLYIASVQYENEKMYTTHSRTAAVVGIADSIAAAEVIAESEVNHIVGPLFHREDIGTVQSIQHRINHMARLKAT